MGEAKNNLLLQLRIATILLVLVMTLLHYYGELIEYLC